MNTPIISVVIPTHNRPEPLSRAVASVEAQTVLPLEVVVVDDGSTPPVEHPGTGSVRVTVVRHDTAHGVAAARNAGARASSGAYVAFLDDDDTWEPGKLEFVNDCLTRRPGTDVVLHRTGFETRPDDSAVSCTPVPDPVARMIRAQPPHLDGVVVRRDSHMANPFDETLVAAEDLDYLIRLARSGNTMAETDAVLAVFSDDNTSVINVEARIAGRLSLLERHPEITEDRHARAFFYTRLGHLQRRGGLRSEAMASFLTSLRADPASSLAWKGIVRTISGR